MIELLISILGTLCAAGIKIACEQYFKRRYEDEIREEVDGWYSYLPGFLRKKRGARYVRLRKPTGVSDSDSDEEVEVDRSHSNDNEVSDDESSLSSITTDSSSQDNWKDPEESVSEIVENIEGSRNSRNEGGADRGDDGSDGDDGGKDGVDGDESGDDSSDDSETQSLLTGKKHTTKSITVAITHPESVYYDTKSSSYSNT